MISYLHLPHLQSFILGEGCLNKWKDDLVIDNYPNLEKIVVKKKSLQNLYSLKIYQCEKLKTVEIEDSAFYYVECVVLESNSIKSTLL